MKTRATALLALLALAGCAGTPRLLVDSSRTVGVESLYHYGAAGRDLQLVVRGNPFGGPQGQFEQAVERNLTGDGLQPPTHPRLHPDASAKSNYQLVLVFTGGVAIDGQDACNGKGGGAGGELELVAAFCVSGRAVTQTTGWVSASGVEDSGFRNLLHAVDSTLFRPDESVQGSGSSGGAP